MRSPTSSAIAPSFTLVALAVLHACSTAAAPDPEPPPDALPCDVDRVLLESCRECHAGAPLFGAPMPLVTYADLTAPAKSDPTKKVWELVTARIHDDARPMPPPPRAKLDSTAMATLDAWLASTSNGAPAGRGRSEVCAPGAPPSAPVALSCKPDLHLAPARRYGVGKDIDDAYVCFGVDVSATAKRHVTAFAPRIDNAAVVHHMVLFQSDTTFDPEPKPCEFFGSTSWRVVAVWAPGTQPFELPAEAGVPIEGTAHYVVQTHYNNVRRLEAQSDASGFDLCSTPELRANDADVMAVGAASFTVPPRASLDLTCDYVAPASFGEGKHILGAMPHMHKIGTLLRTDLLRGGAGAPLEIASRDPWSFETQYWSRLTTETVVRPGDVLRTRCAWKNPSEAPVAFGEGTLDEMCFDFLFYYPRQTAERWSWAVPTAKSTCAPTR